MSSACSRIVAAGGRLPEGALGRADHYRVEPSSVIKFRVGLPSFSLSQGIKVHYLTFFCIGNWGVQMVDEADRGEVIIEFVRLSGLVRVSALDPESLVEVTLQGPAAASEAALRQAVLRKLDYVLARDRARPRASPLARRRSLL